MEYLGKPFNTDEFSSHFMAGLGIHWLRDNDGLCFFYMKCSNHGLIYKENVPGGCEKTIAIIAARERGEPTKYPEIPLVSKGVRVTAEPYDEIEAVIAEHSK